MRKNSLRLFRNIERRNENKLVKKLNELVVEESQNNSRRKKKWLKIVNRDIEK